jgi:hypothetical protein
LDLLTTQSASKCGTVVSADRRALRRLVVRVDNSTDAIGLSQGLLGARDRNRLRLDDFPRNPW